MEKIERAHIALISFLLTDGIGYKTIRKILATYEHPEDIYKDKQCYLKIKGLKKLSEKNLILAEKTYNSLRRENIKTVSLYEHSLPDVFEKYDFLPTLLFLKGRKEILHKKGVGIVGTRRNTMYGARITKHLTEALVSAGITIISGLAEGIDTVAHKNCLEAEGETIAVIGSGFKYKYPTSNKKLYKEIEEKGLLVSEFLPNTKPSAGNFPLRNNTLAALSYVIVVSESYEKGGALITAKAAGKLNKKVFAIPGNLEQEASLGCNKLIAEGKAEMILSINEFVKLLKPEYNYTQKTLFYQKETKNIPEKYLKIVKIFEENYNKPLHIEYLSLKLNVPINKLLGILLEMECSGIIVSLPGNLYKLK